MNTTGKLCLENSSSDVIQMDQAFFSRPWTHGQWLDMDQDVHLLLTWRENNILIGFALFNSIPDDEATHLFKILLHPDRRGDGTIFLFWKEICQKLRELGKKSIYLEVEASNLRAIGFYQKVGFESLRKASGYYSNGEDALIFFLTL